MASGRTGLLVAVLAAAVVVICGVVGFRTTTSRSPAPGAGPSAGAPGSTGGEGTPKPVAVAPSALAPRRKDRAHADEVRRKVAEIRSEKSAAVASARAPSGAGKRLPSPSAQRPEAPAPVGSGNQADQPLGKYIKSIVHEQFFPMAGDCYRDLLAKAPTIRGRLVLSVTVVGDPSVGGVVESVKPADGTTLDDDAFTTCVVESMMSVDFAAPPGGNEFDFIYPFEFSPDPPDDEKH